MRDDPPSGRARASDPAPRETCDVCGSDELYEIKCKVICRNCGTIVRSCADLR